MAGERHPDDGLLAQADDALAWWREQPPGRPTSSLAGTGMIAAAEQALRELLGAERYVLAVPSATAGLQIALEALGIRPGDDVLVPALDWTAGAAAVASLGARAVPVPVDVGTLTIDPDAAAQLRTRRAAAVVATHVLGVGADIPRLRATVGLPVIEDASQALGARLDDVLVGTVGDIAVFSGKGIASDGTDVAEIGFVVTAAADLHNRAVGRSQHPMRQLLAGSARPDAQVLCRRAGPLSALLAAHGLSSWASRATRLDGALPQPPAGTSALLDDRRRGRPGELPLLLDGDVPPHCPGGVWRAAGLCVLPGLPRPDRDRATALARRAGVLTLRTGGGLPPTQWKEVIPWPDAAAAAVR